MPSRFGLAMAQGGGEDEPHRSGEIDTMAGGDVDRGDAVPRADDHSDHLRGGLQRGASSAGEWGIEGLTGQSLLGTPDGWQVEPETEVAGEAKASRVSRPVAIEHENVGFDVESLPRFEQGRGFPEAEQPGKIGERGRRADVARVKDREIPQAENNDSRIDDIRETVKGEIGPGNCLRLLGEGSEPDLATQLALQGNRFRWGEIPAMRWIHPSLSSSAMADPWAGDQRLVPNLNERQGEVERLTRQRMVGIEGDARFRQLSDGEWDGPFRRLHLDRHSQFRLHLAKGEFSAVDRLDQLLDPLAVPFSRGDDDLPGVAELHPDECLLEPLDDHAFPDGEDQWLTPL